MRKEPKTRRKPAAKPAGTRRGAAPAKKKRPALRKGGAARRGGARKKELPAARGPAVGAPPENPEAKALSHRIARLVLEKKAGDVVILDVRGIASYADYVVIASGESDRQVSAMAEHVQTRLREDQHLRAIGAEGADAGQWVLLDFGDVVTHLFQSEARTHYDLEGLWADAPRVSVS